MSFIGYYIKKKNIISVVILLPMLLLITYMGFDYFSSMISNFPHHLLSLIACFLIIIVVIINLFDKIKYKIILLSLITLCSVLFIVLKGGISSSEYETYKTLDNYGINFVGKIKVTSFSGTDKGNVEVITSTDEIHSIKISGRENSKYNFVLTDEENNNYSFEYYYDNDSKSVLLEIIK